MRHVLPILLALLLGVGLVAAFAWMRAGHDRYEALEREGVGIARVVQGAVAESTALLETAERYLAHHLEAVARGLDRDIERTRAPAGEVLQRRAEEERIGRIFLLDDAGTPIAHARTPRPVGAGPGALLTDDEKLGLEWREAQDALRDLAPAAGHGVVEGLRETVYGTRLRFGVAYGRRHGGFLLLRANADDLARLERRFGLLERLRRIAALPQVLRVRVAARSGETLVAAGPLSHPPPPLPPTASPDAQATLGPAGLRVLLPVAAEASAIIDLDLDRSGADRAVGRSRRAILLGGLVALIVAGAALLLVRSTERRHRAEQARAQAHLEEERRYAELGALAALVTHEVANPLNTMRFAVHMLRKDPDPAEREHLVMSIDEGVDRIAAGVEGFLRSASVRDAPRQSIGTDLLDRVRERCQEAADRRGVHVTVREDASLHAWADPLVVEEALVNLVRNAIQATPPDGHVTLSWAHGSDGTVRIAVIDEGPGFGSDGQALLRLGAPRSGGGHGLGLPLARRFVEAQGGRIVLADAEDHGAAVHVFLPADDGERADT